MLRVNNIAACYGAIQAVAGISFQVERGDWCLLIGENGSGKSTSLRCIFGSIQLTAGCILLNGVNTIDVRPWEHLRGWRTGIKVGFMLQGRRLFGALSVAENLAAGGYVLRSRRDVRRSRE